MRSVKKKEFEIFFASDAIAFYAYTLELQADKIFLRQPPISRGARASLYVTARVSKE